jgi:hypothetical protein
MGGGGVPGPEIGDQDGPRAGNVGQSGADTPGPEAANEGVQQNISVSGWPRTIRWTEFRELSNRPSNANEDAQVGTETMTGTPVTVRQGGQWMLAELTLEIVVNRANSWVVTSRKSDDLRAHEQGHFDIHGIIVGRDLVEELRSVRARSNRRLGAAVRRKMRQAMQRGQRMTNAYDEDTNHGLTTARQEAWERQIRNAIDNNTRLTAPN